MNYMEQTKTKLIKLAKELGFESEMFEISTILSLNTKLSYYLWMCELQKWCRDKYDVGVSMYHWGIKVRHSLNHKKYECSIHINDVNVRSNFSETYEEALEEGLYQTLLLIQEKNEYTK